MKKMPKKFKRFDEGGLAEDEDKAEGLAKSKGDKVGLLERLRMGNIDDPSSEAYKRFGAGRARIDRELAPAAYKNQAPNMAGFDTPEPDALEAADRRFRETGPLDTTAGPRAPMAAAAARPVARPPVAAAPARPPVAAAPTRPATPSMPDARMREAGMSRGSRGDASVAGLQAATRIPTPPASSTSSAPSADDAFEAKRRARLMTPGADALEGVYPEAYLGGVGGGLRALLGMGKAAAAKAAPSTGRALAEAETPVTFLGRSGARNVTPAERIGTAPKALPGPKAAEAAADTGTKAVGLSKESVNRAAAKRAAEGPQMSKSEKELLESTMRGRAGRADIKAKRPGPSRPETSAGGKSDRSPRSKTKYDEDNAEYRKGGKVKAYAKGGSVSSASSRADGCAARGKTRGKMY